MSFIFVTSNIPVHIILYILSRQVIISARNYIRHFCQNAGGSVKFYFVTTVQVECIPSGAVPHILFFIYFFYFFYLYISCNIV